MGIGKFTLKQYDSKTRLWTFEYGELRASASAPWGKIFKSKIVVEYPFSDFFLDGLGSIINARVFRMHRGVGIFFDLKIKHREEVT